MGLSWTAIQVLAATGLFYSLMLVIQRLRYHPLSKVPGPKLAAITWYYIVYYDLVKHGGLVDQLEKLHKIYGPVVRIGPEQLHFNDPQAYEDIYVTGTNFTKEPKFYAMFNEDEASFGYIDSKLAKKRKDVIRPLFSRRAILKLEGVMQNTVDRFIDALLSHQSPELTPVDIYFGFLSTSMEIITSYCFAHSYPAIQYPDFRHPLLLAMEATAFIGFIIQHFPFLGPLIYGMPQWVAKIVSPESLAMQDIDIRCTSQIDELLADPSSLEHAEHEIIYHHLLTPQPGKESEGIPSRRSLRDEASAMLFAGTDTVGNTCTMGTFHILRNKSVLKKLLEELKDAWPEKELEVGFETLEKLPYLAAVIKESLRMSHGVVNFLPRVVPSETVIAGFLVPAGTIVGMGATFMHNNPKVFPDPFEFRPERWLQENFRELESHLVPFSKGARSCLGINLAWCELYLIFANVFRKVDMEIFNTTLAINSAEAEDGSGGGLTGKWWREWENANEQPEYIGIGIVGGF